MGMRPEEQRSATIETHRAKESVKDFFEACVPARLRQHFVSTALRHDAEGYGYFLKLKDAIESPSDIPSHTVNCSQYVKESKRLIRAVSFVLLRAYPDGNPESVKYHWHDLD